jgi:hypothetical protein
MNQTKSSLRKHRQSARTVDLSLLKETRRLATTVSFSLKEQLADTSVFCRISFSLKKNPAVGNDCPFFF